MVMGMTFGVSSLAYAKTPPAGKSHYDPVAKRTNTENKMLHGHVNKTRRKKTRNYNPYPHKTVSPNMAAGAKLFARSCATCHGSGGIGTHGAPRLAAPSGVPTTFGGHVHRMERFIAANMPANHPGSLSPTEVKDVTAYVWHIAGGK